MRRYILRGHYSHSAKLVADRLDVVFSDGCTSSPFRSGVWTRGVMRHGRRFCIWWHTLFEVHGQCTPCASVPFPAMSVPQFPSPFLSPTSPVPRSKIFFGPGRVAVCVLAPVWCRDCEYHVFSRKNDGEPSRDDFLRDDSLFRFPKAASLPVGSFMPPR